MGKGVKAGAATPNCAVEEDLPELNGGEATAELSKPSPHNPLAATHSLLFPCQFISKLNHEGVSRSGRYRTLSCLSRSLDRLQIDNHRLHLVLAQILDHSVHDGGRAQHALDHQ